eukprot:TRINITY_DN19846_c0_g1_i5.p1 TRINITY_DN19846_c0_g1~~TRINITY_DN19846_c0_g1_i5.p1  ORF type:complete len:608 (-),score=139.69 TRINITY_DN19846_c0_g1_i5:26-1849(-)
MAISPEKLSVIDFLSPSLHVRLEALSWVQIYDVSPKLFWDVMHVLWGWLAPEDERARSSTHIDELFHTFTDKEQIELKTQAIKAFCDTPREWDSLRPPFRDEIIPRLISFIEDFRQQEDSVLETVYLGLERMFQKPGFCLEEELIKANATQIIVNHLKQSQIPTQAMESVFNVLFKLVQVDPALDEPEMAKLICSLLNRRHDATMSSPAPSACSDRKDVIRQGLDKPSDLSCTLKTHAYDLALCFLFAKNVPSRLARLEQLADAGVFEYVFNDLKGLRPSLNCSVCFLIDVWTRSAECKNAIVRLGLIPALDKMISSPKTQSAAMCLYAGLDPTDSEELLKCGVLKKLLECTDEAKDTAEFSLVLANMATGPCSEEVCGKLFELEKWLDLCKVYLQGRNQLPLRFDAQKRIIDAMVHYGRVSKGSSQLNEVLLELNFFLLSKCQDASLKMEQMDISKSMLSFKVMAIRRLWKANVFLDGNVLKSSGNDALSLLYEFDRSLSDVIQQADSRRNLPPILGVDPLSDLAPRSSFQQSTILTTSAFKTDEFKFEKPSIFVAVPPSFAMKHDRVEFESLFNNPLDSFKSLQVTFESSSRPIKKSSSVKSKRK